MRLSHRSLHSGLLTVLCALPLACSSSRGRTAGLATQSLHGPVRSFTDSDIVHDVSASATVVYVATDRGVLRYTSPEASPTRLGTAQGLPSPRVLALATTEDGTSLWAATATGVVRRDGDGAFSPVGPAQPDVGKPTALLVVGDTVYLGGDTGLARFDGTRWAKLTDQFQVTALARLPDRRIAIATANRGLVLLSADGVTAEEHSVRAGLPEQWVRDVVAVGDGDLWALVQGPLGAQLAYYQSRTRRWFSYTTGDYGRGAWLSLVPTPRGAGLVTPVGYFEITLDRGEDLTPTNSASPGGAEALTFTPVVYEPPPPPPAPEPPPPPPRSHRGRRGRHAAATPTPARRTPPAATHTTPPAAVHTTPTATPATAPATAPATSVGDASVTDAATSDGTATDVSSDASTTATATAAQPAAAPQPPVRPRELPAPGFPVERPSGGPTIDAPTYGLVGIAGRVSDDVVRADVSGRDVFVSRVGLGVTRIATHPGQQPVSYRVHDLAMQHRALSLATDNHGNVWMVSEDGGPVRYNGRSFERVVLDEDPGIHPLLFVTRGRTSVGIARVGDSNVLRGYRLDGATWRRLVEGPVETYGPGTVDARFLSVDSRNRVWVGLRVTVSGGPARDLGVAVLDPDQPVATQYNGNVPETGGENGSLRVPSDVSAVEFDREGHPWFAGLSGLTQLDGTTVRRFREAEGVRGDLVADLVRALNDRIFFATPEGLGSWASNEFTFPVEGSSAQPRATALATDPQGNLWGAGPRGVWKYDGTRFTRFGRAQGLPGEDFNDIAIDAQNRVWLSTTEGLVLYDPAIAAASR